MTAYIVFYMDSGDRQGIDRIHGVYDSLEKANEAVMWLAKDKYSMCPYIDEWEIE